MIIKVRVIPNSKAVSLEKTGESSYKLKIREKPIGGRANVAVIDAISSYFKVKKPNISITKGLASREKEIELLGAIDER